MLRSRRGQGVRHRLSGRDAMPHRLDRTPGRAYFGRSWPYRTAVLKRQPSFPALWQRTLAVLALVLAVALSPAVSEFAGASATAEGATNQYGLVGELTELAAREPLRTPDVAASGKQGNPFALAGGQIAAWAPHRRQLAVPIARHTVAPTHAPRSGLTRAPPLA